MDYFSTRGPSNFKLVFWHKADENKRAAFIKGLFNLIIELPSERKLELLRILRNLYLDSQKTIREKMLAIFYAALFEKKNYRIAYSALDFFTAMWKFFDEEDRNHIFGKLMDYITMSKEDMADEGIHAVADIVEELGPKYRKEFAEVLLKIITGKSAHLKYIAAIRLEELMDKFPEEFPGDKRGGLYNKILKAVEKHRKYGNARIQIALVRLLLKFSILHGKKEEELILKTIVNAIKNANTEDHKEILAVLISFWENVKFIDKTEGLKDIIPFILDIYRNRASYNDTVNTLLERFGAMIWDYIPDREKEKFYSGG